MKPRKLTLAERAAVAVYYLNPKDWLFVSESEFYMKIVNAKTGKKRIIDKYARRIM